MSDSSESERSDDSARDDPHSQANEQREQELKNALWVLKREGDKVYRRRVDKLPWFTDSEAYENEFGKKTQKI